MKLSSPLYAIALAALVACGGKPAAQQQVAPPPGGPLTAFAARRVIVLPTRYLRPADSLGWAAQIRDPRGYLSTLDAEIAFALAERGLKDTWVFPEALARSAKRNAPYATDPHALAAEWLRPPMRKPPELLPEPLASQLRSLVAMQPDTRFVLLPVEVRFEPVPQPGGGAGGGRALLHLVMFDARVSRIVWVGQVASEPVAAFSPAIAASIADNLAALISAP